VEGVFTTAATATFVFIIGDFVSWSEAAEERVRLWSVLISLFLGALAGGLLLVHAQIFAPVLSFVVTILVVVTAATTFTKRTATKGQRRTPTAAIIPL